MVRKASGVWRHGSKLESLLLSVGLEAELGGAALVAEEFGVDTDSGGVALTRLTSDTVSVLLAGLVVSGVVLRLSHDLL